MAEHKADVVIVGGGPAGSTCAWQLQQAGMDVLVIDKADFPRDKICAGWITPAVVESLELDLEDYARDNVLQPLNSFLVGMIGEKTTTVDYGKPVSYGIRRCEFDNYLLKRANPRLLHAKVKHIEKHGNTWRLYSNDGSNDENIETPLLIGAGGHFCPVARLLGAKPGSSEPAVTAQEVEFEMTPEQAKACTAVGEVPELYFCRDLKGYGWLFRKGNFLNIGLGRQDNNKLSRHVDEFVEALQSAGRIPKDPGKKLSGHAYLLYGHGPRQLIHNNVLLIGDSAGLAYPQSGEGIRPAIESAIIAADTIRQCNGNYSASYLHAYVKALEERFGPRNTATQSTFARNLPAGLKRMLAAQFLSTRWFVRNVVLNKWFFHVQQQPLHAGDMSCYN